LYVLYQFLAYFNPPAGISRMAQAVMWVCVIFIQLIAFSAIVWSINDFRLPRRLRQLLIFVTILMLALLVAANSVLGLSLAVAFGFALGLVMVVLGATAFSKLRVGSDGRVELHMSETLLPAYRINRVSRAPLVGRLGACVRVFVSVRVCVLGGRGALGSNCLLALPVSVDTGAVIVACACDVCRTCPILISFSSRDRIVPR
jgi:hypothetical protein